MKTKIMPFSEAMLLGLPEIRFSNYSWLIQRRQEGDDKVCEGCLVGAALYAVGRRTLAFKNEQTTLAKFWPWTANMVIFRCPLCCGWAGRQFSYPLLVKITDVATHLAGHYDRQEITAQEIADIFRKMEPHDEPEPKKEVLDRTPVCSYTGVAEAE